MNSEETESFDLKIFFKKTVNIKILSGELSLTC